VSRRIFRLGTKKPIRKRQHAKNPIGLYRIVPKAAIPVKGLWPRLESGCNIAQPEGSPSAVLEHVQAQEAQVILIAGPVLRFHPG
jgi:hypothetical protein